MLAGLLAQALAFGAKHPSAIFSPAEGFRSPPAVRNPVRSSGSRRLLQFAERFGEVAHFDQVDLLQRADARWRARRIRRAVTRRGDQRAGVEGDGRAMTALRCGSVTWSSTRTSRVLPSADSGFGCSGRPRWRPLVHGFAAGDAVDLACSMELGGKGGLRQVGDAEPLHGVAGDQHTANFVLGDCRARHAPYGCRRDAHTRAGRHGFARRPVCRCAARLLGGLGAPS